MFTINHMLGYAREDLVAAYMLDKFLRYLHDQKT